MRATRVARITLAPPGELCVGGVDEPGVNARRKDHAPNMASTRPARATGCAPAGEASRYTDEIQNYEKDESGKPGESRRPAGPTLENGVRE